MTSAAGHPVNMTWRTGRKVGRTIYQQVGPEPSDDDTLIGMMDTAALAQQVVAAVKAQHDDPHGRGSFTTPPDPSVRHGARTKATLIPADTDTDTDD